ncbi:MAG: DnaJ central domain [Bacteroidota bacterium]|jgi:hypothetical protein
MKKIIATFLIAFALFNIAKAQPDWTGPNLQLGYRWGTVGANIVQLSDLNNANSSLVNQKVRFNNSYLEVKYNRLSKHVYYEMDLSGVILSFDNLVRNKYVEDRKVKNYVQPSAAYSTNSNFSTANIPKLVGNDFQMMEGRIGFGGKGIYIGPQFAIYESRGALFNTKNSIAYGLHGAYLISIDKICRIKATLMYNTYAKGKDVISYNFKGKDITFDATGYFGKSGSSVGLYAGIAIVRKFGNSELPADYNARLNQTAGYTYLEHAVYQSGTMFNFKIGVFLNNGKNGDFENTTISVGTGNGSASKRSIDNSGSNTNTETMCTSCNGKGTYSCTKCGGNGRIPDVKGNGSSNCNSCNGKGYHTCIVCNGKGKK